MFVRKFKKYIEGGHFEFRKKSCVIRLFITSISFAFPKFLTKVMGVASDTFGNPFIQKNLQNYSSSLIITVLGWFAASSKLGMNKIRGVGGQKKSVIFLAQPHKVGQNWHHTYHHLRKLAIVECPLKSGLKLKLLNHFSHRKLTLKVKFWHF